MRALFRLPCMAVISRPRCGEQIRGALLARPRITALYSLTALHWQSAWG